MKKILLLLTVCCMLGILAGCGDNKEKKETTDNIEVNVSDLAEKLSTELTFEDSLSKLDNAVALKYYGIDETIVKDCAIYISTGATAEEIAVFEANSADDAETILAACRTRKDKQVTSYSDYKPSEVDRLEHFVMMREDKYVVFCVNDDVDKAQEIIDNTIQ